MGKASRQLLSDIWKIDTQNSQGAKSIQIKEKSVDN